MKSLRILYVGDLWDGSTALHRMKALEENGHEVKAVDTMPNRLKHKENKIFLKVIRKFFPSFDWVNANSDIKRFIKEYEFDVYWIDKGLSISPKTLNMIKKNRPDCIIAGFSPDDMHNPANQSQRFLGGLRLYDIYFTTKSYGVDELKQMGCPRAEFINNSYDPAVHRPVSISAGEREKFGGPVGFIGQWESERGESICFLAEHSILVRVWGYAWEKCKKHPEALRIENKPVWGDDYARAICSFDINLCFLKKGNRDLQTTRSIEIPACGGFMLAERTVEHIELFEEGKEAEFFGSDEELLDKVRFYLKNEKLRKQIALAGRERCLKGRYSHNHRMEEACLKIEQLSGYVGR